MIADSIRDNPFTCSFDALILSVLLCPTLARVVSLYMNRPGRAAWVRSSPIARTSHAHLVSCAVPEVLGARGRAPIGRAAAGSPGRPRPAQRRAALFQRAHTPLYPGPASSDDHPGDQRRRQRPRLAAPGDPRLQRPPGDERHRLPYRFRGADDHTPLGPLPTITVPVVIDGTTQPGFAGSPIIELDGANLGNWGDGLQISAGHSTVRGLVINRFGLDGIDLVGNGGNVIQGNFLGTDVSGTVALANSSGTSDDVYIDGSLQQPDRRHDPPSPQRHCGRHQRHP